MELAAPRIRSGTAAATTTTAGRRRCRRGGDQSERGTSSARRIIGIHEAVAVIVEAVPADLRLRRPRGLVEARGPEGQVVASIRISGARRNLGYVEQCVFAAECPERWRCHEHANRFTFSRSQISQRPRDHSRPARWFKCGAGAGAVERDARRWKVDNSHAPGRIAPEIRHVDAIAQLFPSADHDAVESIRRLVRRHVGLTGTPWNKPNLAPRCEGAARIVQGDRRNPPNIGRTKEQRHRSGAAERPTFRAQTADERDLGATFRPDIDDAECGNGRAHGDEDRGKRGPDAIIAGLKPTDGSASWSAEAEK